MNTTLTQTLYTKYPKLYVGSRENQPYDTPIPCGDGWFSILEALSDCIQNHIDDHNHSVDFFKDKEDIPEWAPRKKITCQVLQVKEKFGGLVVYVSHYTKDIRGYLKMSNTLSYRTCEYCGGKGRKTKTNWIKVLCEDCESEWQRDMYTWRTRHIQLKLPFEDLK